MKSFAAVIAVAVLGVSGFCRAADEAAVILQSGDFGAPNRALKAVLSDFIGNQFVGSVVWHTDDVASPGQPPTLVVRADIEIPDIGMALRLELRRNEDETLAASHTVELVFTLPSNFPHGEIANVPDILMKEGETAGGTALEGVFVKVADNFFLFGLSSVEADRLRNIQLIERPWIDIPIAYSNGKRANIVVEKASPGARALAVLELPTALPPAAPVRKVPTVPINHPPGEATLKPWPVASATPAVLRPVVQPSVQMSLPVLERPTWAWPPGKFWWAAAPGSASVRRTWQAGWQPAVSETVRLASTTGLASTSGPTVPTWLRAMSTLTAVDIVAPPWPRVRAPDLRIPMEPSHLARLEHLDHLAPPAKFVRWSDRFETVLPADEVNQRCQAAGAKRPAPGRAVRGCAHFAAGRCFIIRVDDPGVARHELAHCNGWKHPE
jgi:hypothetical protein